MAGSYSLIGNNLTLANAVVTLTFVNPIASPNFDIHFRRFWCGQSANVTSYQQRVQLVTQPTTFPTLVSVTPTKLSIADGASIITGNTTGAAGTCGVNASGEGSGTKVVIWADVFNNVNGWLTVLTPEELLHAEAGAASGVGMYFPVAAVPLTNWSFGCTWSED